MPPEPQTQPNVDVNPTNAGTQQPAPQAPAPSTEPAPQTPPAEAGRPSQQQPQAPQQQPPAQQPQQPQGQPQQQPSQDEPFDLNSYYGLDQVPDLQDIDLTQLPVDEYGTVSLQDLQAALMQQRQIDGQRARQEATRAILEVENERRDVQAVVETYPAIREDRSLFELVLNQRDAAAMRGQNLTLVQAAKQLFDKFNQQRQEGAQQANTNTTVQRAAHLSSSGAPTSGGEATEKELRAQLRSGDPQQVETARHTLMKRMMRDGRIKVDL